MRQKPENLRELARGKSVRELADELDIPRSTVQRWLASEPRVFVPRFAGYGHGAPAWKTAPGTARPRHRIRLSGAQYREEHPDDRDRPGYVWSPEFENPPDRIARVLDGPGRWPAYTYREAKDRIAQGNRSPRPLSREEAELADRNRAEDRAKRVSIEDWVYLGFGSAPGWSLPRAVPPAVVVDANFDREHDPGAADHYRAVYQRARVAGKSHREADRLAMKEWAAPRIQGGRTFAPTLAGRGDKPRDAQQTRNGNGAAVGSLAAIVRRSRTPQPS